MKEPDRFTVPNLLGMGRLLLSPVLLFLGAAGRSRALLFLYLALTFTDWIDGKLAVWLDQRSELGARIDSVADWVMYASLLGGLFWLDGPRLAGEWPWIGAGCLSWALAAGAGVMRFGRIPTYHTRMAKISWFLVLVAVVALLEVGTLVPFRVAAAAVTVTNLEVWAITWGLKPPRSGGA